MNTAGKKVTTLKAKRSSVGKMNGGGSKAITSLKAKKTPVGSMSGTKTSMRTKKY